MAILTQEFLHSIGVNLSDEDFSSLSEHYEQELDNRVVNEIVQELTESQLEHLAMMQNAGDDALQNWLKTTVQDLPAIIEDEVAILLGEIAENSDKL